VPSSDIDCLTMAIDERRVIIRTFTRTGQWPIGLEIRGFADRMESRWDSGPRFHRILAPADVRGCPPGGLGTYSSNVSWTKFLTTRIFRKERLRLVKHSRRRIGKHEVQVRNEIARPSSSAREVDLYTSPKLREALLKEMVGIKRTC